MDGIFVYADDFSLSAEMLALANKLGGKKVTAITLNEDEAAELVKYGADLVLVLAGDNTWPESYAAPMAELLVERGASLFLVGATVRGRDIASRVASFLGWGLISDAQSVTTNEGVMETERMMYGGSVVLSEVIDGVGIITVPPGKYQVAKDESRTGEIVKLRVKTDERVKVVNTASLEREGVDLGRAQRIVCVGAGFNAAEDLRLAQELAAVLGAEIGCTRPIAEDRGWLPAARYIGISGAVVKPELYIALGVSGQIQHTYGIRDAKIIVGINNNDKAPIFKAADYGIVGDLYEIAPLIADAVKDV